MSADILPVAALWWAVIFSGLYHGINPGMGWPLAVSAGLMEQRAQALVRALGLLALGHFLSMLAILLPFSMLFILVDYELEIRVAAGLIVSATGVYLLINRRHPRYLARIAPSRLALWSFLAAFAHGAGLMLVPIYLGLCATQDLSDGHQAAETLMRGDLTLALLVAGVHTLAMTTAGAVIAAGVYWWLGLRFLSKSWFNLDLFWACSLILVGSFGIWSAFVGHG